MELPLDLWYSAIRHRYSHRTYNGEQLGNDTLGILEELCGKFRPFRGVRAIILRSPPKGVYKGIIGSYGEIKNAPHLAAIIGEIPVPEVQEAAGYLGEGIILQATSMGLRTCWIGGFFRPEALEQAIELGENEEILAITPIGYGGNKKSTRDRVMSLAIRSQRRKPLEKLLTHSDTVLSPWTKQALEAARLAPSAANRQPWRFTVDSESIIVSTSKGTSYSRISKRLDCGIAMLHLELGARAYGAKGKWELLSAPYVAKYSIS
ncbi:MAG: nitroreductase family protein [Candidatus Thorarchaeota archaeon]